MRAKKTNIGRGRDEAAGFVSAPLSARLIRRCEPSAIARALCPRPDVVRVHYLPIRRRVAVNGFVAINDKCASDRSAVIDHA